MNWIAALFRRRRLNADQLVTRLSLRPDVAAVEQLPNGELRVYASGDPEEVASYIRANAPSVHGDVFYTGAQLQSQGGQLS
jgi:hypothetical protein